MDICAGEFLVALVMFDQGPIALKFALLPAQPWVIFELKNTGRRSNGLSAPVAGAGVFVRVPHGATTKAESTFARLALVMRMRFCGGLISPK